MNRSNRGMGRVLAVAAVSAVTLGVTSGCTAGSPAPEETTSALAVKTGARPPQDVIDLYTDRDTAVATAVERLPEQIDDALERSGVPGAAVAVVSKGEVIYSDGFGVRDNTTNELVDTDTVFQIASMSKPLSSTIIAKAMTEDENLSWTTPVRDLLPDFEMADPYVTANATIGDYFAHRTGIPTRGGDDLEDIGYDRDYILDHLGLIPLAPFRTSYQYSNFGITTGAEAVAASRGQTWEETADELLFEPLGMTSTSASYADYTAAPNRAVLHAQTGPTTFEPLFEREPDAQAPAGGVSSTVGDVAKWMELVLAGGELDGAEFIDPDVLSETFSAQIVSSSPGSIDSRPGHYGFGINVSATVGGRVSLNHSGGFSTGAATLTTLVPDLDLGIVVLTNGAPVGIPEAITSIFLDNVLYDTSTRDWVGDWSVPFSAYADPSGDLVGQEAPDGASIEAASNYVGTYNSPYFGDFVVTERGGVLTGALGPDGGYTFELQPWEGDTLAFAPTGENANPGSLSSAVFVRDGGPATTVTLTYFNNYVYGHSEQENGLGVFTRVD